MFADHLVNAAYLWDESSGANAAARNEGTAARAERRVSFEREDEEGKSEEEEEKELEAAVQLRGGGG